MYKDKDGLKITFAGGGWVKDFPDGKFQKIIRSKVEEEVKRLAIDKDFDSSKVRFEIKGGIHFSWEDDEI